MERVDAHFGWARSIMVYDIQPDSYTLDKTVVFDGTLEEDGNEDKINPKLEALQDCAIVYVADIGGPAAARVVASKIHPIKSQESGVHQRPDRRDSESHERHAATLVAQKP